MQTMAQINLPTLETSVLDESPFLLKKSPHVFAEFTGEAPAISAVFKWTLYGTRGVVLETAESPKGRVTSRQAIRRFLVALTRVKSPVRSDLAETNVVTPIPSARLREIEVVMTNATRDRGRF